MLGRVFIGNRHSHPRRVHSARDHCQVLARHLRAWFSEVQRICYKGLKCHGTEGAQYYVHSIHPEKLDTNINMLAGRLHCNTASVLRIQDNTQEPRNTERENQQKGTTDPPNFQAVCLQTICCWAQIAHFPTKPMTLQAGPGTNFPLISTPCS